MSVSNKEGRRKKKQNRYNPLAKTVSQDTQSQILRSPGKVVDLLYVQTARATAAQRHGYEDTVVDGRTRPGTALQVVAVLQDSLQPPALSQA